MFENTAIYEMSIVVTKIIRNGGRCLFNYNATLKKTQRKSLFDIFNDSVNRQAVQSHAQK